MVNEEASRREWALFYSAVLCGYLPKQTDVIFIHAQNDLEVDLLGRVAELYLDFHLRPKIVLNGLVQYENKENSSGYEEWKRILMLSDVERSDILKITTARHTGEEATKIVKLCEKKGWKKLVIAATPQRLARCFLTVMGVLQDRGTALSVYCLTVANIDWQEKCEKHSVIQGSVAGDRFEHFEDEFERILKYRNAYIAGDSKITPVASVKSALEYFKNRSK